MTVKLNKQWRFCYNSETFITHGVSYRFFLPKG